MYILKNAWISIKRNKGRNILIGVIVLIVACACTIALAIQDTANDLIASYKNAYEKEATIGFNRENMMKDFDPSARTESRENMREKFNQVASYTIADVENFAGSEHVEDYYYTYSVGLNGENIEKAEIEASEGGAGGAGPEKPSGMGRGEEQSTTDFTLTGYSSQEAMSEFVNGTYTMSEIADDAWDKAFDGNYVFINEELVTYNNLGLNSTIKLADEDGKTYDFEVIGIFKENEEAKPGSISPFSNSVNKLVTNSKAVENIVQDNSNLKATIYPTFIIDAYENADAIQAEFYEKGLDENYVLQTNEETANSGVSSIENVSTFATMFLVVTFVIGGVVLLVINMINIRERRYEIWVFRTIGVSKSKVTLQFVAELTMVSLVALLIGAGIGAVSSQGISNALLANEINNSSERVAEVGKNFGKEDMGGNMPERGGERGVMHGMGMPVVQAYDSIDAVVDARVLLELLGVGILLVLVSSIASMISIQRFSPLAILKERS